MKKPILVFAAALVLLVCLTSCISSTRVIDIREVQGIVQMADRNNYKSVASMKKSFDIRYSLFTNTQKPSDEEMLEKIQQQTEKKYGPGAIAADISFTRIVKDTTDFVALLPDINANFSKTDYIIDAIWNVYILK